MPDACHSFLPRNKLMNAGEIERISAEFIKLGVTKIRLTGGEPLLRKDFEEIINRLSKFPVELLLTTNGLLINKYLETIISAGISTVNVSLDSLNPETFFKITQHNRFHHVWNNILLLLKNNIRVKINTVAVKGYVENEIFDFINLTKELPLHVRFIEFMPFNGNKWNFTKVVTSESLLQLVTKEYDIVKLRDEPNATAKKFKVIGNEGTFAFITTMSNQFCSDCNRLRLTAEGKIKNCLFGKEEFDILSLHRNGKSIVDLIQQAVRNKQSAMGGQFEKGYEHTDASTIYNRSMVSIGG